MVSDGTYFMSLDGNNFFKKVLDYYNTLVAGVNTDYRSNKLCPQGTICKHLNTGDNVYNYEYGMCIDKHVDLMLHCIGYNQLVHHYEKRFYMYERYNKHYYKYYRNYFSAGPADEEIWNQLVQMGFAERHKSDPSTFGVSPDGFELLALLLDTIIVNKENPEERYAGDKYRR